MILTIKNMVCDRCKKVVKENLEKLNISIKSMELGKIEIQGSLTSQQIESIKDILEKEGFKLLENPQLKIIEQIKNLVIQHIHHEKVKMVNQNFSDFLAKKIGKDYSSLSKIFSSHEEITIEHFIIFQKIEKAKELLKYNEKNLSEIAWELDYSSVQHLSSQFKKVTGMTPSTFKSNKNGLRKSLDDL